MNNFLLVTSSVLVGICACTNVGDNQNKMNVSEAFYADYSIKSVERNKQVTILLQFRKGGSEGTAVALPSQAKVLFDGEQINADSARFSGVYYEVVKPTAEFSGKHKIDYISADGKKQALEFIFQPLNLVKEPPQKVSPNNYKLVFAQRDVSDATVHLIVTDTAFDSDDINLKLPLIDNAIEITAAMWRSLKPGPAVLEIFLEEAIPLPSSSREGGKLSIEYGLKREFILLPGKTNLRYHPK